MLRLLLYLAAVFLLVINGVLHGLWTQRWTGLTESAVQAAADRLAQVPLVVGEWRGERVETDSSLPEEVVGKNVAIRYVHRTNGYTVTVYLACGHTITMEMHTPRECYPAAGYKMAGAEARVSLLPASGEASEFLAATFSRVEASTMVQLRMFWAWKDDSSSWRAPDHMGRTFRASPFLYKCYAVRALITPEEPLESDPCSELLRELIPELNRALAQ
jgi:hypothetical protein